MNKIVSYLIFFFFFLSFVPALAIRPHLVNMYYGNWQHYNGYPVCKIPGEKIDKLIYNFLLTDAGCDFANYELDLEIRGPVDGVCGSELQPETDELKGNMYQFLQLKKRFPHLKIIASIVGSHGLHDIMLDETKRQNLVKGCVDLLDSYPSVFDGIDMDLEYPCLPHDQNCGGIKPSDDDMGQFSALIKLFREKIRPGSFLGITMNLDFIKIDAFDYEFLEPLVDEYHLMTYNIADGAWTAYSGHHTQPYGNPDDPIAWRRQLTTYNSAKHLLDKNLVNPSKILIGACFYGRGFKINPGTYTTPFVPSLGVTGTGSYVDTPNIFYYWDIQKNYVNAQTYHFDEAAKAPFIYDEVKGIFITYDDVNSVQAKVDIVHELGIGGIFGWELGMDRDGDLVDVLNNNPSTCSDENCKASNNCRCPSFNIPGGLSLNETPQFVVLGFDNAILANDFKKLDNFDFLLKNDNIRDSLGCTPKITGYFGGQWGDYNMVAFADRFGSVAMESYSYPNDENIDAATWKSELETLVKDFQYLAKVSPIGSRAPFFHANDAYFQQLLNMGIKFDSSMIVNNDAETKKVLWPFTLDYPGVIDQSMCNFRGKCPSKAYKGLWEFPVTSFDYNNLYNFVDFDVDESNYDTLLESFKQNFRDSYTTNKGPRSLNMRWNYFSNGWFDCINSIKMQFIVEFLTWMTQTYSDIVFATESQVIDWVKNPIPISQMTGTCADISFAPISSCPNGVQTKCYYTVANPIVCGSLCPDQMPNLGVTWSLSTTGTTTTTDKDSTTDIETNFNICSDSNTNSTTNDSTNDSNDGSTNDSNDGSTNDSNDGSTNDSNDGSANDSNDGSDDGSNDGSNDGSDDGSNDGSETLNWPGTVELSFYPAWGTTGVQGGFCTSSIKIKNNDPIRTAYFFVFTLRHCSQIGSLTSNPWGYSQSSIDAAALNFPADQSGFRIISDSWFTLPPGSEAQGIGFCMNVNDVAYADPKNFVVGVDFYENRISCSPLTCPAICGQQNCETSWYEGQSLTCDGSCNIDCAAI